MSKLIKLDLKINGSVHLECTCRIELPPKAAGFSAVVGNVDDTLSHESETNKEL